MERLQQRSDWRRMHFSRLLGVLCIQIQKARAEYRRRTAQCSKLGSFARPEANPPRRTLISLPNPRLTVQRCQTHSLFGNRLQTRHANTWIRSSWVVTKRYSLAFTAVGWSSRLELVSN